MVPYGLNQEQFVSMYQRKLDRLSDQTIRALREILTLPLGHGVDEAHLEIFPDEYGGAPSVWAYWRGKNNKVDHVDQSLFPGRSLELDLDLKDLAEIDEQYFVGPDEFFRAGSRSHGGKLVGGRILCQQLWPCMILGRMGGCSCPRAAPNKSFKPNPLRGSA